MNVSITPSAEILDLAATQTVIPVLGFHRSGTSLVAKILHTLGIPMGDDNGKGMLIGEAVENPGGYYEDEDFMDLSTRLMTAVGGGWENPPSTERLLNRYNSKEGLDSMIAPVIKAKLERGHVLWGFKDPRTCVTWPLLAPYLPNRRLIIVKRDLEATISSLLFRERQNMALQKALALYTNYAIRIERYAREEKAFYLQYESLIDGGTDHARAIIERLIGFVFGPVILPSEKIDKAVDLIDPDLNRSSGERISQI